jgi:hypothetical protein
MIPRPWDPVVLGAVLMIVALVLKRSLADGGAGARAGFTAARLSRDDADAMRAVSVASSTFHPAAERPETGDPSAFRGGRSGGGGAGADF